MDPAPQRPPVALAGGAADETTQRNAGEGQRNANATGARRHTQGVDMRAWAGASPPGAAAGPGAPGDPAVTARFEAAAGAAKKVIAGAKGAAKGLSPTKEPVTNGFIDGRPGFMRTRKGAREIVEVFPETGRR